MIFGAVGRCIAACVVALALSPLPKDADAAKSAKLAHPGVPALDPRDETEIIGKGTSKPLHADSQGNWTVGPALVGLDKVDKAGNWWLSGHADAVSQDGFVRARVSMASADSGGLAVRAKIERTGKLAQFHGYVIGPHKGRLEIRRQQGGASTTLVGGPALSCKGSCLLEIAVWMVGPHLVVKAYDGATMKELASLVASDATMPTGAIGLRYNGDGEFKCQGLWLRKANTPLPPRAGALGRLRYLAVPAALAEQVVDIDAKIVSRTDSTVVIQLTAEGKEALLRRIPTAQEIFADEPREFSDPAFRAAAVQPVVPTPTGFVLNSSYKDSAITEALLRAYAKRFADFGTLVEIGRSRQGRPLLALRIHAGPTPPDAVPQVLINGTHHGVELAALEFALDGCAYLLENAATDDEVKRWLTQLTVWCVPLVNPDGNDVYMHVSHHGGRKNGRDTDGNGRVDPTDGVDLNRNYPYRWHSLGEGASHSDHRRAWYRGPRAASEPETQAMMRLADAQRFVASVSFHTAANAILVPYTIPQAPDPEPNEAWKIGELMAQRAGVQVNGRLLTVKRRLYAVDGVDQDWHRAAHGTSAFLVEGTLTNPGNDKLRKMVEATRGTWMGLLERTVQGPGLWGRVRTAQGQPIVAEVRVRQVALKDGERWTSRCQDGRFGRLLAATGPHTVDAIDADGGVVATAEVEVAAGQLTSVELVVNSALPATSCSRPDLCSIDSLCAAERKNCATAGLARFCRIDGKCVERGTQSPMGRCEPDRDPWVWTAS
ncbi:MAG: hypothetical protein EXR77_16205 [Myxococcales bacterium]|nr:hypothetical protein [Myxococcales bacterium]